jgi:hypothetical protein
MGGSKGRVRGAVMRPGRLETTKRSVGPDDFPAMLIWAILFGTSVGVVIATEAGKM